MSRRWSLRLLGWAIAGCALVIACDSKYTSDPAAEDAGGHDAGSIADAGTVEVDGGGATDGSMLPIDGATPEASVDVDGGACGQDCHTMFVTSTTFPANLGGQAGADQKCKAVAATSQIPGIAARASRFIAWISTGNSGDPGMAARLPNDTAKATFARVDGKPIALSTAELLSGTIRINIVEDESGSAILTGNLMGATWTGTAASGKTSANTCSDWASTNGSGDIGQASEVTGNWTNAGPLMCNQSKHLYCLEQ